MPEIRLNTEQHSPPPTVDLQSAGSPSGSTRPSTTGALLFMMRTKSDAQCRSLGGELVRGTSCKLRCTAQEAPQPLVEQTHLQESSAVVPLRWQDEETPHGKSFAGNQTATERMQQLEQCGSRRVFCGFGAPSVRCAQAHAVACLGYVKR